MALVYLKGRQPKRFFPQTVVSAGCFAVDHCGSVFWLRTFLEHLSYALRVPSSTSSVAFPELF